MLSTTSALRSRHILLTVSAQKGVTSSICHGPGHLFHRLGGFSGGVSLAEPLLPASSLTRNTRNTRTS